MKKIIFSLTLFIFFASGIYYLGYTTPGLHTLIRVTSQLIPGQLTIQQIDGTFADQIQIRNLHYHYNSTDVVINEAKMTWSPRYLINQEIIIEELSANEINIKNVSQKQTTQASNPLAYLKHVVISKASIKQLNLNYNQQPITLKQINLSRAGTGMTHLDADIEVNNIVDQLANHSITGHLNLNLRHDELEIKQASLFAGKASAEVSGFVKKKWDIHWKINAPQIKDFLPHLSGSLMTSGQIQGERQNPIIKMSLLANQFKNDIYAVEHLESEQTIQLSRPSSLEFKAKGLRYKDSTITALTGTITSEPQRQALLLNIKLFDDQQNRLTGMIKLPQGLSHPSLSQPIEGNLKFELANVAIIKLISSELKNPIGHASADLELNGKLNDPKLNAKIALQQISFDLPRYVVNIRQLNVNGQMTAPDLMSFKGTFSAGKGVGQVEGQLNLNQRVLTTSITGHDLQTVNTHKYQLTLDPKLNLKLSPTDISLTGDVFISNARLILTDYYNVVSLPDEVKLTTKTKQQLSIPLNLALDLTLNLGKDIFVTYDKFEGTLGGKLTINQVSGHPATAIGEIHAIKGHYNTYGKTLKISEARMMYSGNPLTNPGIYIKAQKKFETLAIQKSNNNFISDTGLQSAYTGESMIIAGVQLTGSLRHPNVGLYSLPAGLSQQDILSYLMFGHPQANAKNPGAVLSALSSIYAGGNSKIGNVTDKLKSTFALSDFGIDSADIYDTETNKIVSTPTIGIGKKLGKNLYLRFRMGVLNPISILNIRYQLSKHFSLQSESSPNENGADLFYTVETD